MEYRAVSGSGAGWSFGVDGQIVTATYVAVLGVGASSGFQIQSAISAAPGTELINVAHVSGGGQVDQSNDAEASIAKLFSHKSASFVPFSISQNEED